MENSAIMNKIRFNSLIKCTMSNMANFGLWPQWTVICHEEKETPTRISGSDCDKIHFVVWFQTAVGTKECVLLYPSSWSSQKISKQWGHFGMCSQLPAVEQESQLLLYQSVSRCQGYKDSEVIAGRKGYNFVITDYPPLWEPWIRHQCRCFGYAHYELGLHAEVSPHLYICFCGKGWARIIKMGGK